MLKILLLGKNGQVGWELQRSLAPLGEVLALDRHSTHYCGDLSKPEELAQTVLAYKPDFIVNAAAHTAVDKAESESDLAKVLNTDAPAALAKAAAQVGAWLVHYSTDYLIIYALRISWKDNCAIARVGLKFNYFLKIGDLAACRRSIEQELR